MGEIEVDFAVVTFLHGLEILDRSGQEKAGRQDGTEDVPSVGELESGHVVTSDKPPYPQTQYHIKKKKSI